MLFLLGKCCFFCLEVGFWLIVLFGILLYLEIFIYFLRVDVGFCFLVSSFSCGEGVIRMVLGLFFCLVSEVGEIYFGMCICFFWSVLEVLGRMRGERILFLLVRNKCLFFFYYLYMIFMVLVVLES